MESIGKLLLRTVNDNNKLKYLIKRNITQLIFYLTYKNISLESYENMNSCTCLIYRLWNVRFKYNYI